VPGRNYKCGRHFQGRGSSLMDEDCRSLEQTLPRSLGHRRELTAILSHEVNGVASLTRSPSSFRPARLCIRHFDGGYG